MKTAAKRQAYKVMVGTRVAHKTSSEKLAIQQFERTCEEVSLSPASSPVSVTLYRDKQMIDEYVAHQAPRHRAGWFLIAPR